MGDNAPTMPVLDVLCKEELTPQQWLNYYRNIWVRNLVARTVDVETDIEMKKQNPEEKVLLDDGREVTVKERLEVRKLLIEDALKIVRAIDKLAAIPAQEFAATVWSEEALKVASDMVEAEEKPQEATGQAEEPQAEVETPKAEESQPEAPVEAVEATVVDQAQ